MFSGGGSLCEPGRVLGFVSLLSPAPHQVCLSNAFQLNRHHIFNFLSITNVPDQKISTLAARSKTGISGLVV